jgi:hypothetical protein
MMRVKEEFMTEAQRAFHALDLSKYRRESCCVCGDMNERHHDLHLVPPELAAYIDYIRVCTKCLDKHKAKILRFRAKDNKLQYCVLKTERIKVPETSWKDMPVFDGTLKVRSIKPKRIKGEIRMVTSRHVDIIKPQDAATPEATATLNTKGMI